MISGSVSIEDILVSSLPPPPLVITITSRQTCAFLFMLASFLVSVGNNLELQLGEVEQEVVAIVVVVASDVSCN